MSKTIAVIAAALMFSSASAQEEIFSLGMQLGVGARAIAMGGAYTALGGDYSASLWNPAALADIRRVEVYGTLSYLSRGNEFSLSPTTSFSNSLSKSDENFTNLSTFGIAYPLPTYRGSLVFSFGYNRVKSLDSNFEFVSFNQTSNDLVYQAWREIEKGSLNARSSLTDLSKSSPTPAE